MTNLPAIPESSLSLPPDRGLASPLLGSDTPDAITLVGRHRLSQALELEEKPDNRYLRYALYGLGAAVLIFFPWAALTPITQVVSASGEVIPEGEVSVVQHLEGGIVERVDVRDGDMVSQGQVMLQLRPNLVESEYRAIEQQLRNLMLQQRQFQAAIRGESGSLSQSASDKVSKAQSDLLDSRIENRTDQIRQVNEKINEKREELKGLDAQIQRYRVEQNLLKEQRQMYANLVASGAASRLNLLQVDKQVAESQTKMASLLGTRAQATKLLLQAEAELRSLNSGIRFEERSQIAALVNEEAVVSQNIKKLRNQLDRTKIRAPISGEVNDLRFKTTGGVIAPGSVVLSLVPTNSPKIVEARVRSTDIGFVSKGQTVSVKLKPFDSSIYGSVSGKVLNISPSTVQDPDDRQYYYETRISLDQQYVGSGDKKFPIQVGMPVVADIEGPKRSVLRYLFQPFTRTLNSALRESR
ncbi:HlyD family type I secretion periplasmic adaptor subunit [Synechococcus sp. CCY9201]|uniref:HlyD family type I secretion periplasmic adaptor subunit n=1 Tax=Synechococcus sp. CCY9201 TaxID=174697 RepID=UPI0018CD48B0|nr:HlyD family type I secretion periplasmic adaptor subunit [Synechococcus sp. CCY9201]MEA5475621.1 HlyD family type I secretion periplasmic adaptor subunit [Synechococcus sp. CCY9201]QPN65979.1 HlyD family type I secretion periplasmic adaptor subunit [Synechococcus sp. CBW1006]